MTGLIPGPLVHHGPPPGLCEAGESRSIATGEDNQLLQLTDHARQMIGQLRVHRGLPDAGLRIARRRSGPGLCMSLENEPYPGDVVFRSQDAVVFLDETALDRLAGQTLDARWNAQGAAFFL